MATALSVTTAGCIYSSEHWADGRGLGENGLDKSVELTVGFLTVRFEDPLLHWSPGKEG